MTLEQARTLLLLVREGVLLTLEVAREVSREVVGRLRAPRVTIRDERRQTGGSVHGR